MPAGSSMDIDFPKRTPRGWKTAKLSMVVTVPISFRLSEDIIRNVESKEQYLQKLPDIDAPKEPQEQSLFEYAWDKFFVFAQQDEENKEKISKLFKKAQDSVKVAVKAKKIKLLSPAKGQLIYPINYPKSIEIYWKKPSKYKLNYEIFLWKHDKNKPELANATTSQNFYTLSANEAGSYFVQVVSDDGDYASEAHIIHLSDPGFDQTLTEKTLANNKIDLTFPKHKTMIVGGKTKSTVTFSWARKSKDNSSKLILSIKKMVPKSKRKGNYRKNLCGSTKRGVSLGNTQ